MNLKYILLFFLYLNKIYFNLAQSPEILSSFLNKYLQQTSQYGKIVFSLCNTIEWKVNFSMKLKFFSKHIKLDEINTMNDKSPHHVIFLVDIRCEEAIKYLETTVNPKYYAHPYRWILLSDRTISSLNLTAFPDSNILFVSQVNDTQGEWILQQFYRIDRGFPLIWENIGTWKSTNELKIIEKQSILSRRRRNLQQKKMQVTTVILNNNSVHHLDDYIDKHIDSMSKINYIFIKMLLETLNASAEFSYSNTWGYYNRKTGEWSGMIRRLIDKEADIGGTVMFMNTERIKLIDYISLTTYTYAAFIFRDPPLSYIENIYALPFDSYVWICSSILVILHIFVIKIIFYFQSNIVGVVDTDNSNRFTDFILMGISLVCQMGSKLHLNTFSGRIALIFLEIILLFLYTSYCANIVALLQSGAHNIKTLSDLLNSQLKVGVQDTPYNRYYFPNEIDPIKKALYQKKVLSEKGVPAFLNISVGIEKLRKEFFAFHFEHGPGFYEIKKTFLEHEKCKLRNIYYFYDQSTWLPIQKFSPYKEMLKVNLFSIREYGLQNRENDKIYEKAPFCSSNQQSFDSVSLRDCYVALVIWAVGVTISIIILIIEKLFPNSKVLKL